VFLTDRSVASRVVTRTRTPAAMTMYEAYSAYRGTGADFAPDALVLKKLRLRVEADDQQHPPLKKLKICGMDLEELPPEVFHMFELEVGTPTFKLLGS